MTIRPLSRYFKGDVAYERYSARGRKGEARNDTHSFVHMGYVVQQYIEMIDVAIWPFAPIHLQNSTHPLPFLMSARPAPEPMMVVAQQNKTLEMGLIGNSIIFVIRKKH